MNEIYECLYLFLLTRNFVIYVLIIKLRFSYVSKTSGIFLVRILSISVEVNKVLKDMDVFGN